MSRSKLKSKSRSGLGQGQSQGQGQGRGQGQDQGQGLGQGQGQCQTQGQGQQLIREKPKWKSEKEINLEPLLPYFSKTNTILDIVFKGTVVNQVCPYRNGKSLKTLFTAL